jgi:hypothetical protein
MCVLFTLATAGFSYFQASLGSEGLIGMRSACPDTTTTGSTIIIIIACCYNNPCHLFPHSLGH